MKREEKDVAQRLLEDYLAHVEARGERSSRPDRMSVVVLDVLQYRRLVPRITKGDAAGVQGSSRLLP